MLEEECGMTANPDIPEVQSMNALHKGHSMELKAYFNR
jgi:hypothetical protein